MVTRRNKKKRLTVIQQFTQFERSKSKDIKSMIVSEGINPLNVVSVSIGGASRYTTADICNYFEQTGRPFSKVSSSIACKKKGDTYERKPIR